MHLSTSLILVAAAVAWLPLTGHAQQVGSPPGSPPSPLDSGGGQMIQPTGASPTPASPVMQPGAGRSPAIEVPYDRQVGFILLPVTIHGQALQLLLDHGTGATLLAGATMTRIGLTGAVLDSLTIGTSALHDVPIVQQDIGRDGLLGAPALSHYDFVFDGPARRVRLYAIPPEGTHSTWLPPGVTPADCTPILPDANGFHRVFFDLQANGKPLHSMFDSGARFVNINMAAARLLGLSTTSPNVQPIDGTYALRTGPAILKATHVPLTVGRNHIRVTDSPVHIFQDLPRESGPDDPELSLGLFAILDRIFVVSYSTGRVCLGAPRV